MKEKIKVIFLDIDGVLNSTKSILALGGAPHGILEEQKKYIDMIALGLLQRICMHENIKCVLSSTWRILNTYQEVGEFFNLPIIGATPRGGILTMPSGFTMEIASIRGMEVQRWLEENTQWDIQSYVILDDNSDFLDEQKPYLVQTTYEEGLTFKDYLKLCELLEIDSLEKLVEN